MVSASIRSTRCSSPWRWRSASASRFQLGTRRGRFSLRWPASRPTSRRRVRPEHMSRPERIAITGVGAISALGQGARASWRALLEGRRGIRPVRLFDAGGQHCRVAAEIDLRLEDVVPAAERQEWSRSDGLALIAAREALADARLAAGAAGLSIAIGGPTGGMFEAVAVLSTLEQTPAEDRAVQRLLSYPLSTTGERLARVLGPVERVATVCSACSSSANAIVQGAAWI